MSVSLFSARTRIKWVDVLKGVLLLFICFSHFGALPEFVSPFVSPTASYWVPMFFILSGYLWRPPYEKGFSAYFWSKTKSLLMPFVGFGLLFVLLDWNTYNLSNGELSSNIQRIFVYGDGPSKAAPLWFVWTLFLTTLVSYPIMRLIEKNCLFLLLLLVLSLLAYSFSIIGLCIPLKFHLLPSSIVFYSGGAIIKKLNAKYIFFLLSIVLGVGGFFLQIGDYHLNQIDLYPFFFLCPIALFYLLSVIMSKFEQKAYDNRFADAFIWIARNGIVILAVHCYLTIVFDKIVELVLPSISNMLLIFLLKTVFCFSVLFFVAVPLYNKIMPLFLEKLFLHEVRK